MKLGVFTPVYGRLSTAEMVASVRALRHVDAVELGTGGWPGRSHLDDLGELIDGPCRATTYRQMLSDAGLTISALSCHANPLHPGKEIVSALRLAGYDDVISIEHEDALASPDEGLRMAVDLLARVILSEPPSTPWWT